MRELEQILQLWEQAGNSDDPPVLATVVRTQGSSYRLPGARLILLPDGRRAGSISGGCLEGDLIAKARWLTRNGPILRRYDTNAEGEIGTGGFGLGCNGIVHVLIERILPSDCNILDTLAEVHSTRRPAAVSHVLAPDPLRGRRLLLTAGGAITHNVAADVAPPLEAAAHAVLRSGQSALTAVDGLYIFAETLVPPIRLLIFGAGDDAIPLSAMARYLGWRIHVFDGRAQYARSSRFPDAQVTLRPPGGGVPLDIDPWTVAVLMTHSYSQDLDILRELAATTMPGYIGVLGPRKRTDRLLSDAAIESMYSGDALHSPMGLDIGADGPEQVALAVIAEIQAVLNRRTGGPLRSRRGSIHSPAEDPQPVPETHQLDPAGPTVCA